MEEGRNEKEGFGREKREMREKSYERIFCFVVVFFLIKWYFFVIILIKEIKLNNK